ncbi:MAG TPA: MBOAT family O-acyltransferase [Alphaproteobacteria bacterium]|nr:MBOAT family O-acyltransferase [Alphaproteobacteria bacterium]
MRSAIGAGPVVVFSSPYFIFLFLPVALAVVLGLRRLAFLPAIFLASVVFYFWSAGPRAALLVGIIVVNYVGALLLRRAGARLVLPVFIGLNLLVLFWFKYAHFVGENLDLLLGTGLGAMTAKITLPAGVSFFVFQAISYLMDVRRGEIGAETSFFRYAAYQSFFPHLIAGPIVRFRDVIGDFIRPRLGVDTFSAGISRFAHGLLKKVVIADNVAPIADAVFSLPAGEAGFASAWIGAAAYALQIYFDFSGYSDMAIGLAMMFGIRFTENFHRPYASRSITEFWRRWHVTLSSWFRDYLYVPLGGNRGGPIATYRNLLIVFVATGLWHGAGWTFLCWGLFHGLFLVLERLLVGAPLRHLTAGALRYLYCLPVVLFGWVLFRADGLGRAVDLWSAMLQPFALESLVQLSERTAATPYSLAAMACGALIFILPGETSFGLRLMQQAERRGRPALDLAYAVGALALSGILVITGNYSPFLYFQF